MKTNLSTDSAQSSFGPQDWEAAPSTIDQFVHQFRHNLDEYINKQWMGLEQLQNSYKQTFAEKEKAIEQGESLLRAEQGQNSVLRN